MANDSLLRKGIIFGIIVLFVGTGITSARDICKMGYSIKDNLQDKSSLKTLYSDSVPSLIFGPVITKVPEIIDTVYVDDDFNESTPGWGV